MIGDGEEGKRTPVMGLMAIVCVCVVSELVYWRWYWEVLVVVQHQLRRSRIRSSPVVVGRRFTTSYPSSADADFSGKASNLRCQDFHFNLDHQTSTEVGGISLPPQHLSHSLFESYTSHRLLLFETLHLKNCMSS